MCASAHSNDGIQIGFPRKLLSGDQVSSDDARLLPNGRRESTGGTCSSATTPLVK